MASGYLHKACAENAAERAGILNISKEALVLGAQGPDPLLTLGIFPLRPSSRPGKAGGVLHQTRTGAHLLALLKAARGLSIVEQSYAMGFLTHYALDSTVHPYVYAKSLNTRGKYSSTMHMQLEKRWDALYFKRDGLKGTPKFMPGVTEAKPHWDKIAGVWSQAINQVYPELSLSKDALILAFQTAERVNRLTHSPRGIKYALFFCLERLIGKPRLLTSQVTPRFLPKIDIENSQNAPWRSAAFPEAERTEGLSALFEMAIGRAEELLCAAQAYFLGNMDEETLAQIIGNVGYGTGAPLADE